MLEQRKNQCFQCGRTSLETKLKEDFFPSDGLTEIFCIDQEECATYASKLQENNDNSKSISNEKFEKEIKKFFSN